MIVSILSHSIISPLGEGSELNFQAVQRGDSGITLLEPSVFSETAVYAAHIQKLTAQGDLTRFETLTLRSIEDALANNKVSLDLSRTAFVLATTKGNIELLEISDIKNENLLLHHSANKLAKRLGVAQYHVVSNACASGVVAVMLGKHLLETNIVDHVIVTGADVLSKFIVSGFQSLHALSDEPCKPFDASRKGLNLGEAAATIILSSTHAGETVVLGSAATNDSNHISGPSRTGEELSTAVQQALQEAKRPVDFISAHGTATLYNDEMEAKAFNHAGHGQTPVNSLKGYFGHTLGAAGLLEIVMSIQSLKHNTLLATKGFTTLGVSMPVNVIAKTENKELTAFLKTASGFGGCNAAVVIGKRS